MCPRCVVTVCVRCVLIVCSLCAHCVLIVYTLTVHMSHVHVHVHVHVLATVSQLIYHHPEAIALPLNEDDHRPLHCALTQGVHDSVVRVLLDFDPDAAQLADKRGRLPLHLALEKERPSYATVAALLASYPGAASEPIPLPELEQRSAAASSKGARPRGAYGAAKGGRRSPSTPADAPTLPIHAAIAHGATHSVIQALAEAAPEAVTAKDPTGRLPLHMALERCASQLRPQQATRSEQAKAPGALAARRLRSDASAEPQAGSDMGREEGEEDGEEEADEGEVVDDGEGATSQVQAAARRKDASRVAMYLLQEHREACEVHDALGRLPLHSALAAGAPDEVVLAVLEENPAAVHAHDGGGKSPLHLAMESGASKALVWQLITMNPEAARTIDAAGISGAAAGVAISAVVEGGPSAMSTAASVAGAPSSSHEAALSTRGSGSAQHSRRVTWR